MMDTTNAEEESTDRSVNCTRLRINERKLKILNFNLEKTVKL